MRLDQRVVTKIPLAELWDEQGTLPKKRLRHLDQENLIELLRTVPFQFVIADGGAKLLWIPAGQRFEFWKTVKPQIADPAKPVYKEQFPGEVAYIASEWRDRGGECLILLEKYH